MQSFCCTLLPALALVISQAALVRAEDFSFEALCAKARKMAAAPHAASKLELADFWKNLNYDEHRDIRFQMESGLWVKEKGSYTYKLFIAHRTELQRQQLPTLRAYDGRLAYFSELELRCGAPKSKFTLMAMPSGRVC